MTIISLIAAMSKNRVIGINNTLPWHLPDELKYFKATTMGKPMIMGRKTFDAIGRRVLPGRKTIVLTHDTDLHGENFAVAHSVHGALQAAGDAAEVMIVGGSGVFKEFLPIANRIYLSIIDQEYTGDAFFPDFDLNQWHLISQQQQSGFIANIYENTQEINNVAR